MTFKDLEVYKRSYTLALKVHKFFLTLPKNLQFDIADQIRRASRSIPSNIAEGYARSKSNKDKINFLKNALGSNEEMLFNLEFLKDVGLAGKQEYSLLVDEYTICGRQLYRLLVSLK